MANTVVVERCPSNQTYCAKCKSKIGADTLRVYIHRYFGTKYFHLRCFKPYEPKPVTLNKDIILHTQFTETEMKRVKKWIEAWNSRFQLKEVPQKFLAKSVPTITTPARRRLIEVFQCLTVVEVERLAALTCKEWFHFTRDEELWKVRYLLEFKPSETEAEASYREKYIARRINGCWHCKKVVGIDDVFMQCPLHKRPLCRTCSAEKDCQRTSIYHLTKEKLVAKSLIARLEIPTFQLRGAKTTYICDVKKCVFQYADRRRLALLDCLEKDSDSVPPKAVQALKELDVSKLYENGRPWSREEQLFLSFFGSDEAKKNWNQCVQDFVKCAKVYW